MVQLLSIFLFLIFSIFVGVFKSSRFFCVILYLEIKLVFVITVIVTHVLCFVDRTSWYNSCK